MLLDPRYAQPLVFDELYGPGDLRCEMKNLHASFLLWSGCSDWTSSAPLRRSQLRSSCESLDTDMARALGAGSLDGETYGCAWRVVRRAEDREQRVALMLTMSAALDRHTRNALLRHSLRLRRPASQAAGLGSLQRFLESGFETFRAMKGAGHFLQTIADRERALSAHLFAGGSVPGATCVP